MVMHRSALKHWQDTDSLHAYPSTLAMNGVVCEMFGAGDVQPVQLAFNPQATLVKVGDIRGNELLLDPIQTGLNLVNQRCIGIQYQGFRGGMAVEVSQQLSSACQGNELVVVQVGRLGFDPGAILNRLSHI